jgi:hypothetical protein
VNKTTTLKHKLWLTTEQLHVVYLAMSRVTSTIHMMRLLLKKGMSWFKFLRNVVPKCLALTA